VLAQSKFAALDAQYATFRNYEGTSRPSLPDYAALVAGGYLFSQGVFGGNPAGKDGVFVVGQSSTPNIFSQLIAAGHSWKAYEEGVNGPGGYTTWGNAGTNSLHVARHCPASFFAQTQNPGSNHGNGRYDFDELVYDINHQSLPDYFWASPNLVNSGHNTGVAAANQWLINGNGGIFPGIDTMIAAMRPDGLLAITFDNVPVADTTAPITGTGKVYMVACGPKITHSSSSIYNNHFGFLRAVQNLFGVAKLTTGADSNYTNATPLALPTVTNPNPPPNPPPITSPLPGAVINATTVTVTWTPPT
jgi:hypothetical protein